jgi:Mn-containing catalase
MIACSYNIAIEEFSHLEMVGKLVAQHTSKIDQTSVYAAPLSGSRAAARTSLTAKAAAGRRHISRKAAATSFNIFAPTRRRP